MGYYTLKIDYVDGEYDSYIIEYGNPEKLIQSIRSEGYITLAITTEILGKRRNIFTTHNLTNVVSFEIENTEAFLNENVYDVVEFKDE